VILFLRSKRRASSVITVEIIMAVTVANPKNMTMTMTMTKDMAGILVRILLGQSVGVTVSDVSQTENCHTSNFFNKFDFFNFGNNLNLFCQYQEQIFLYTISLVKHLKEAP
jgi:hypothetical protein